MRRSTVPPPLWKEPLPRARLRGFLSVRNLPACGRGPVRVAHLERQPALKWSQHAGRPTSSSPGRHGHATQPGKPTQTRSCAGAAAPFPLTGGCLTRKRAKLASGVSPLSPPRGPRGPLPKSPRVIVPAGSSRAIVPKLRGRHESVQKHHVPEPEKSIRAAFSLQFLSRPRRFWTVVTCSLKTPISYSS